MMKGLTRRAAGVYRNQAGQLVDDRGKPFKTPNRMGGVKPGNTIAAAVRQNTQQIGAVRPDNNQIDPNSEMGRRISEMMQNGQFQGKPLPGYTPQTGGGLQAAPATGVGINPNASDMSAPRMPMGGFGHPSNPFVGIPSQRPSPYAPTQTGPQQAPPMPPIGAPMEQMFAQQQMDPIRRSETLSPGIGLNGQRLTPQQLGQQLAYRMNGGR